MALLFADPNLSARFGMQCLDREKVSVDVQSEASYLVGGGPIALLAAASRLWRNNKDCLDLPSIRMSLFSW